MLASFGSCYGAKDVQTPRLDQFAAEGLRFTHCYAGHANCSPSRTASDNKYLEVRAESPTWPAWKFSNVEGQRIEWPAYTKRPPQKKR